MEILCGLYQRPGLLDVCDIPSLNNYHCFRCMLTPHCHYGPSGTFTGTLQKYDCWGAPRSRAFETQRPACPRGLSAPVPSTTAATQPPTTAVLKLLTRHSAPTASPSAPFATRRLWTASCTLVDTCACATNAPSSNGRAGGRESAPYAGARSETSSKHSDHKPPLSPPVTFNFDKSVRTSICRSADDNSCYEALSTSFGSNGITECTICYEKTVDCVLYTCGHMCMCY